MNLAVPPAPLTARQRTIVLAVAMLCAATRFLTLARTLWDWDEALFVLGMGDYNVAMHQPHPPGFPVYIGLARLVRLVVANDFRALQSINVVAAMLIFPALFQFARELRLRFEVAFGAAVLFAFFPNVWFFGGGAFSDIPSIVLVLFAVTFLLRGARDRGAYFVGTLLLALAIGIRPQNLLLGMIPGLYATRKRRVWEVLVAFLIGVTVVLIAFGGAVYATGSWDEYLRVVREHGDYISRVDSWRSPDRPPLWRLLDRFFVKQYQSPLISVIASLFVLVSIGGAIRDRDRSLLMNALTFVPFAIFAWLMLDRFSISRFSIGYQPMFAIFLADGIRRVSQGRQRIEATITAAFIASFCIYTLPSMDTVRNDIAPSILAVRAAVQHVDPARDRLYVGHTMSKFVDLYAPGFPYTRVLDDRAVPLSAPRRAWLLAEITDTGYRGYVFRRDRGTLWNIARRHYFEIKLQPLRAQPRFVSGWYTPEVTDIEEWRWMGRRSLTVLPSANGRTLLRFQFAIPKETTPHNPSITVKLNGQVIDRFRTASSFVDRDYRVTAAPSGMPNVLELSIDRVVTPATDGRELGLRVRSLSWGPA